VFGETVTFTAVADWITTLAEADLVVSATEVALTVADDGVGTVAGAVYKPDDVIVPQEPETQPVPETLQVTAVFELPVTVALNCCVPFTAIIMESGEIETLTPPPEPRVTTAVPTWDRSNNEAALTVTVAGLGVAIGAVYRPVELICPQVMPLQPAPVTLQTTTLEPVALNCNCAPGLTCADEGETVTEAAAVADAMSRTSSDTTPASF
jgi:hypothetical protein